MTQGKLTSAEQFMHALQSNAEDFGFYLSVEQNKILCEYFQILSSWNARLHLVAPCTPAEFATRHILESLVALSHIPEDACAVDVGSGGGLPIIPCLIVRPDLTAVLIEASAKKGVFLTEALRKVGCEKRARVVTERFEKIDPHMADVLTCRALERFSEMLPDIFAWSTTVKKFLLFGGEAIREQIEDAHLSYRAVHIPHSEKRYLFVCS